jgi:hypothetical protein
MNGKRTLTGPLSFPNPRQMAVEDLVWVGGNGYKSMVSMGDCGMVNSGTMVQSASVPGGGPTLNP